MIDFQETVRRMAEVTPTPEDYIGDDGLLYCGKCRTPKQFRMDAPPMEGRLFPCPCQCEQERRQREDATREARRHDQTIADLKRQGFTDRTFEKFDELKRRTIWQIPRRPKPPTARKSSRVLSLSVNLTANAVCGRLLNRR